ncbi:hypothetical protein GQ53DRAFT_816569 [Thozetella sp. PMI_491]|nr:hypothetical protein GQ53DRAFT_816569 [Thozetella sp. PMI_491]
MKGRPVEELVYEYMFPRPKPTDPQNFSGLLQRHLVLEVRQEVHSFYGHLETQEAKYPGLDYNHSTHRIRLSRWTWHRRLFRAFDGLRLTPAEISSLTRWEGTKWAKERYERDSGCTIQDTTDAGFPNWTDPEYRASERATSQETEDRGETADDPMAAEESDEEPLQSVGEALNERLRARVEQINQTGDTSMPLDEEWEQWLKNAIESGEFPQVADQIARLGAPQHELFPPLMLAAGREGRWDEIPDFLQDTVRLALSGEQRRGSERPSTTLDAAAIAIRRNIYNSSERRRTFSNLRLPLGDTGGGLPSPASQRSTRPNA